MDGKVVVNLGIQRFDRLIEEHKFYVDKTDFIREWGENEADVLPMPRLRKNSMRQS